MSSLRAMDRGSELEKSRRLQLYAEVQCVFYLNIFKDQVIAIYLFSYELIVLYKLLNVNG